VSPSVVSTTGGAGLTVRGSNFPFDAAGVRCSFGGLEVRAHATVSSSAIVCVSPALAAGATALSVSWGNGISTKALELTVYEPPTVREAAPSQGSASGGSVVTVFGERFVAPMTCMFGTEGWAVDAKVVSSSEVQCMTKAHAEGSVSVQVSRNGVEYSQSDVQYVFSLAATVSKVTPRVMRVDAAELVVTVAGENFVSDTKCTIGQAECTTSVLSSTEILCRASRLAVGNHTVSLSPDAGTLDGLDRVTVSVVDPPEVVRIEPSRAHIREGTRLVVHGKNFITEGEVTCVFGSMHRSRGVRVDGSRVTCVSPKAGEAGSLELSVVLGGMESNGGSLMLVAQDQAKLLAVHPSRCSVGGCAVEVVGETLGEDYSVCRFGTQTTAATMVSSLVVRCDAPAVELPGVVNVEVMSSSGDLWSSELSFTYDPSASVSSVQPSMAHSGGVVQVVGSNFLPGGELECRFGEKGRSGATWESSSVVRCQVPSLPHGEVAVGVRNYATDDGGDLGRLEITGCCAARGIRPSRGSVQGGTRVTVSGIGIETTDKLVCNFGGVHAVAEVVSTSSVTCESPWFLAAGTVEVRLMDESAASGTGDAVEFEYMARVEVTRVMPSVGPVGGGRLVTVVGSGFATTGEGSCRMQNAVSKGRLVSST
ncbi:hypothetical protein T484DRAFT_3299981, partial [Baffinella frigidus]